ncbi:MAG: flavin-dependent dehydrogenase [Phycisphaerales bacterium]|nr:flavin-dependent dehydrogenase [Phycisphaerales bacterium]
MQRKRNSTFRPSPQPSPPSTREREHEETPNVTIIGAGPAGSVAAILLARGGWDVTLLEQHRFPRDKVCGECLSALGIDVLERIGLGDRLRALRPVNLTKAILHAGNGDFAITPLPRPMLGISRAVFDQFLLDEAQRAGTRVLQPARCEGLEPTRTGARLRVRDLQRNTVETFEAAHVIVADGKSALPGPTPKYTGDFGIKSHWEGISGERDAIELFGCRGCYGGLAPIEGGRWNAAFSVPAERLRAHSGNLDALFAELISENAGLARRLKGATRAGDWLAAPLPRFAVRRAWPAGVVPVGNAAAAIEPIGGEGMGLALRSAELAVNSLIASEGIDAKDQRSRLRRDYGALWRIRRAACRAGARVVSSRMMAAISTEVLNSHARSGVLAMKLMGKSG